MERMVGEAAKRKLYNAAKSGDIAMFQEALLQEDPDILDEVSFAYSRNLLHIATMHMQPAIVEEVLKINPQLARDLDTKNSSSLHIAAKQGSLEIAQKLFSIAPEALWWQDWHGMNPVHVAAINGHIEVVEMMLNLDYSPAMERTGRGQTMLHLCVKHGQVGVLKVLVNKLGDLVRATDDDGETLLHLAVRYNQLETIQYLVEVTGVIKKDIRNSMGKTALNILQDIPRDTISNYSEIQKILENMPHQLIAESVKLGEITMVVVVLIATMAFTISVNPPGGVWPDDKLPDTAAQAPAPTLTPASAPGLSSISAPFHRAGEAVMASTNYPMYRSLMSYNSTALLSSLVTIFLIISGFSSRYNRALWLALVALWLSISSIACSCVVAMLFLANPGRQPLSSSTMRAISFGVYAVGIFPMGYVFSKDFK